MAQQMLKRVYCAWKTDKFFIFVSELGLGDFPYFPVVPVTVKVRHLRILYLFAAIVSRIPLYENHIITSSSGYCVCLFVWKTSEEKLRDFLSTFSPHWKPHLLSKKLLSLKKLFLRSVLRIGIRDPVLFLPLDPGWFFLIPDPGFQIPYLMIFLRA